MNRRSHAIGLFVIMLFLMLGLTASPAFAELPLNAPESVTLVRTPGKNMISWQSVEGAASYKVYAAGSPSGTFKLLGSTKALSYLHKNAPSTKFYKVRAVQGKSVSIYSELVGSVAGATGMKGTVTGNTISFTWKAASHATSYRLECASAKGGPWTAVLENIGSASCSVPLDSTEPRYYRLVSLYNLTPTGVSVVKAVFQPISNVRVICEESYSAGPTDRINVTWSECTGATGYEVYRAKLPSGEYTLLGTTTHTYYADKRPEKSIFSYKVKPIYGETVGEESAPVTLWSAMKSNVLPNADLASKSGILLLVNKKAQVVTAYIQDEQGNYTIVLRHMICSTGRVYERTPVGEYTLDSKHGEWYQYPSGVYIRYPSIYKSGLFFHSVLYTSSKSVNTGTVSLLGTRQSLGCIRLKVNDAKWVYQNCVNGTKVSIVDGKSISSLTKALKPRSVKVK